MTITTAPQEQILRCRFCGSIFVYVRNRRLICTSCGVSYMTVEAERKMVRYSKSPHYAFGDKWCPYDNLLVPMGNPYWSINKCPFCGRTLRGRKH